MTDKEIERVYLQHRTLFLSWSVKRFGLSKDEALDVYQEAIVAFTRNVRGDKFNPTSSVPSTYLFAIGRNLALNTIRSRRSDHWEDVPRLHIAHPPESDRLFEEQHKVHLIDNGMKALTEKEREILRLYYMEDRSMTEIALVMGYNNALVAKKMKCVAFRKLATHILKMVNPERTAHVQ